jgi:hypothetical protein
MPIDALVSLAAVGLIVIGWAVYEWRHKAGRKDERARQAQELGRPMARLSAAQKQLSAALGPEAPASVKRLAALYTKQELGQ